MESDIKTKAAELKALLDESNYAVFFGGAGVSTASGIPDFRGSAGLYTNNGMGNEYYLSRRCLVKEPTLFYEFFLANMVYPNAKPNGAHIALAKLESEGIIKAIITQNIDGLHQAAGSKKVIELHGNTAVFYCERCGKIYETCNVVAGGSVPCCASCGGTVRPNVVLYGEALPADAFDEAERNIQKADLLIVGGTSLTVFPAASLVADYKGKRMVIINLSPTPYDEYADLVIRAPIDKVLSLAVEAAEHTMHLMEKPFSLIWDEAKTIELRLYDEKRQKLKKGDLLRFVSKTGDREITARITALHRFKGFKELYDNLPLDKCGYSSGEEAHYTDMENYYTKEEQSLFGVVGIEFEMISKQINKT